MRVTAITRYKHGELFAILKRLNWTQTELARRSGLNVGTVGDIINLHKRPTEEQANAIQSAFGNAGQYLDVLAEWPESFAGIKRGYRREQTEDVPLDRLIDCHEALQIAAPEIRDEDEMPENFIESVVGELTDQQQRVIHERYWNTKSLKQTGIDISRSSQRVRQIEAAALRKLRHPERIRKLASFSPSILEE